jgi:molybdopterin molybdotransferase
MSADSLASIAASLEGLEPEALSLAQAREILERLIWPPRQREMVALHEALGRVLASDVISGQCLPALATAAAHGYALRGEEIDLEGNTRFELAGAATEPIGPSQPLRHCLSVRQGEEMPAGFDTVAPHHAVSREENSVVVPARSVWRGDFCRQAGSDIPLASVAVPAGRRLSAIDIGLLASLHQENVAVWRRLRVATLVTGEHRAVDQPLLAALLRRLGVEAIDLGAVDADHEALFDALRHGQRQADAIIGVGGIGGSVPEIERSLLCDVLAELGQAQAWNLALSPGGPLLLGQIGSPGESALFFGLSGDPASMIGSYYALVCPALLGLSGSTLTSLPMLRAAAAHGLRKQRGMTELKCGWVQRDSAYGWLVEATSPPGASTLGAMSRANGIIVLGHGQGDVRAGEFVNVLPFEGLN